MPQANAGILPSVWKGMGAAARFFAALVLYRLTTDFVVGAGLIAVLLISVITGNGTTELQTNIAAGLVGYLGRSAMDEIHRGYERSFGAGPEKEPGQAAGGKTK